MCTFMYIPRMRFIASIIIFIGIGTAIWFIAGTPPKEAEAPGGDTPVIQEDEQTEEMEEIEEDTTATDTPSEGTDIGMEYPIPDDETLLVQ